MKITITTRDKNQRLDRDGLVKEAFNKMLTMGSTVRVKKIFGRGRFAELEIDEADLSVMRDKYSEKFAFSTERPRVHPF